ncbi:MAG TPA: hypothetical protein VGF95_06820 [Solirubrobacteraceae bacterium]|jgi:anti-sigma factor RsiW
MSEMPRDDIESELAGLADGSLTPERRAQALLRVENDPELASELAEQRHALVMLQSAQTVQAPASLHVAVERLVSEHSPANERGPTAERARRRRPARRWRLERRPLGLAGVAAGIAAVIALALALAPSSGGGPTLAAAVTLTQRPAALAAPTESTSGTDRLTASVDGVSFPYWEQRFGWRASGERTAAVGGRSARAVYYTNAHGARVGYAIVAGGALPAHGGRIVWRRDVAYRLLSVDGVSTVTWLRGGHTCVLAGRGVRPATLVRLASWSEA